MLTVNVQVRVKKEFINEFITETIKNAKESNKESGIKRFDIIQDINDPQNFLLVEVYTTEDAPAKHKETAHYETWRDSVAKMMEIPRTSIKYSSVYTKDTNYEL